MADRSRVNVLGVGISAATMDSACRTIETWIAEREPHYVCVTGVHGVMASQADSELRGIHNRAGLVTPDGMPLVWIGRLQGHRQMDRVYGPDLMLALCERSVPRGYRNYFYGGAASVPEQLAEGLQSRFPGLQVSGTYSPPFRPLTPDEDADVVTKINAAQSDIVWVGLGTPKQERWMAAHVGRIDAPVLLGVGAAFDFHTGRLPQAPNWMRRSGLEWCFRLLTEPKRLWRRYLSNNPRFVALVLLQGLGLRHYSLDGE